MTAGKLTNKQRAFVAEYLVSLNATHPSTRFARYIIAKKRLSMLCVVVRRFRFQGRNHLTKKCLHPFQKFGLPLFVIGRFRNCPMER